MKMFVRAKDNDTEAIVYKWVDVKPSGFDLYGITDVDGVCYHEIDILRIKNDLRKTHVICKECGKLILNNPKAIERHFAESEKKINCLNCNKMSTRATGREGKIHYKKQGNGFYKVVRSEEAELLCTACRYYWSNPNALITDPVSKEGKIEHCIHCGHRRKGVKPCANSLLMTYPDAFKYLATEKKLLEDGWKLVEINKNPACDRVYKYKSHNLYAYVDMNGIIKYFETTYRGSSYLCVYSKAYDSFFKLSCGVFVVTKCKRPLVSSNLTDDKVETYTKAIKKLYN